MRIDDAILSGSVVGSSATVSLTGSFTGSGHLTLADTASIATSASYAVSSSHVEFADSSSYAVTASHAVTSSLALSVESSSYSTTASYALTASVLLGAIISASYSVTSSHAITASYVDFVTSASYATTASYALNAETFDFATVYETTNFTFAKDTFHIVSQSALTGTLPATPTDGDRVAFMKVGTTSSLIERNGSNLMFLGEDMTIDSNNASFQLLYSGATPGWILLGANN